MLSHELTKGRAHHDTPGTATAAHGSPSLSLCCPSRSIEHRRRGRVDRARGGKLLRGPCMWHRNRIDGSCRWCALCSSTTAPGCTMTDPVSLSTEPKATPLRNAPTVSPMHCVKPDVTQAPCKVSQHKHNRWGDHRAEKHPKPTVPLYTVQKKPRPL
jgi:hypothetical protein